MIVLWITILLAAIAVGMSQDSRTQTLLTRNQLALAKARALADGAVERAMYEHLRPPYPDKVWFPNGAVHGWEEDGARLAVSLAYESGRIDVNVAREPLLKGLFTSAAGLEPEAVNRIVDAIMDWRDPDDAETHQQRRAADYRAAQELCACQRQFRNHRGTAKGPGHDARDLRQGRRFDYRPFPTARDRSRGRFARSAACDSEHDS
ncbi:MAG: general secretion pathway protein GspK [Betaproteobacteria bacterium]|nr:general secretion pathway protein GspK [Betaproteobacteria bacterium]